MKYATTRPIAARPVNALLDAAPPVNAGPPGLVVDEGPTGVLVGLEPVPEGEVPLEGPVGKPLGGPEMVVMPVGMIVVIGGQ